MENKLNEPYTETQYLNSAKNTYGEGIDPSAVVDLYKVVGYLVDISEYRSFSIHHFLPAFKAAKAAIKKAKGE